MSKICAALLVLGALCALHLPASAQEKKPAKKPAPVSEDTIKKIAAALPDKAPAKPDRPRKVLVFTLARGFVHGSIPVGAKAIEMMGQKTGAYETVISNDVASFEPDNLKQFDAIVMVSTTGRDLFGPSTAAIDKLPAEEQAKWLRLRGSLLKFVSGGKGLMGIHAASDALYDYWPEYGELIGGYFNGHPWGKITMKLDDSMSPINACFGGKEYTIQDEIYTFKAPYSREKLHILTSIDLAKSNITKGNRADNDYAVSWIRNYGKGRVFYCSLGHRNETYWNPVILQHYLAGLQFALGDLQADATPSSQAKK